MPRYATRFNKRDQSESELVKIARECGALIVEGAPLDFWLYANVGARAGEWVPVECKTPGGNAKRFQPSQVAFMADCDAKGAPYYVWRTADDVVRDLSSFGQR